ncbi:DUF6191 domain-containing protein [Streptomyces buecherae]|uniref:DUF6191 domain-containing protein n=1 Tax=Streptomyces buecherae TaxID=2763006 RepID=UPI0036548E7B
MPLFGRPPSRRSCSGAPVRAPSVSATGFDQLHASFSPGEQHELKEGQSALVLPDDEDDGAPPHRTTVDLERGTVVVRVPGGGR